MKIKYPTRQIVVILLIGISFLLIACQPPQSHTAQPSSPTARSIVGPTVLVLTPERYTFPTDSAVDDLIRAAGGYNAAAPYPGIAEINDRLLLEMNPDLIIFTQSWAQADISAWLQAAPYQQLAAVRNGHTFYLEFDLTDDAISANRNAYLRVLRQWFELV